MISLSIVLVLYICEIGKTAKKPRVMSFLPWIGCQTLVSGDDYNKKNRHNF